MEAITVNEERYRTMITDFFPQTEQCAKYHIPDATKDIFCMNDLRIYVVFTALGNKIMRFDPVNALKANITQTIA